MDTYSSELTLLGPCTLSYPKLATFEVNEKGNERFGATLIVKKGSAAHKKALQLVKDVTEKNAWTGKAPESPIKEGDERVGDDGEVPEGYAGCVYFNANFTRKAGSEAMPQLCNADRSTLPPGSPRWYAGAVVNVGIQAWPFFKQDKMVNRVCFGLEALQFVADGPRLASRQQVDVKTFFSDVSEGETGEEDPLG